MPEIGEHRLVRLDKRQQIELEALWFLVIDEWAWGLTSTSRLSYFLETDGSTREEIAIIEESVEKKSPSGEVANKMELEK